MVNGGDGWTEGRKDGHLEKERDRVGRPQKFIGPFCRQTFLVGPGLITKTEEDTD